MNTSSATTRNSKPGIQAFLILDLFARLTIWSIAFATVSAAFTRLGLWPKQPLIGANWETAWNWGQTLTLWMIGFNVVYVAVLLVLRLPIPNPREGRYRMRPGEKPDKQLVRAAMIAVITKARYEAPFPGFFVHHICNLPPMCWLVEAIMGPRNKSCNVTQPMIPDPHHTTIGRNVVIGFGATITAHAQGRDEVTVARTTVEDEVLIGANSLIYGGCTVKRGAIVLGGAVVRPFTTIEENEVWGGVPAKKVGELPRESAGSRE